MPYPLFLDLTGKAALVVGAGGVGRRKIAGLAGRGLTRILAVDPTLPKKRDLFPCGTPVEYECRGFAPEDIEGMTLVFACTDSREINAAVASACRERGVLCNVADNPADGGFFVPALVERGDITLAVGTGGAGPALSRFLRKELEDWLGNRYTALAAVLRRLRPALLGLGLETAENTRIFRSLVHSPLAEHLAAGNAEAAEKILRELLPQSLHAAIGVLLHEL